MTEPETHLPPEDEAELVALADGTLPCGRLVELEARMAREPALAAAVERQRAALAQIAGLDTRAPLPLRLRVEELKTCRRRRRWIPAAFLATAAATAALALALIGGGPAIEDVFAVGLRPATAAVTADEQVDGVRFPRPAGWRAVGARRDVVAGRETRTVFYERGELRIAYTIVAGPALADEDWVAVSGRRKAYAWPRDGRTCLIAGQVPEAALRAAAAWR